MILPITAKTNKKGRLEIGGCDTAGLAEKFGTPLYVIDEATLRKSCADYRKAFSLYKDAAFIYASKALCCKGVLEIIAEEGFGVDVASGGELFTALKAGISPGRIYFHGNNKTGEEIELAVKSRVGCFVVDNFEELRSLEQYASLLKKRVGIILRVNPSVDAHTHEFIKTGMTDSKFGFLAADVLEAAEIIKDSMDLEFRGLHAHVGSQISETTPFLSEIDVLFKLASKIKEELCLDTRELNIGGGLGIAYTDEDKEPDKNRFAAAVIEKVIACSKKYDLNRPRIVLEPGRSVVGQAGMTIYEVGAVKRIPGIRNYVIVDGGIADNPRFALYGAKYSAYLASSMKAKQKELVTIAGRACESGDVIIKDIMMPEMKRGDLIAVAATGAYNYSMSSNYNRFLKPAMVLVSKGKARLLVKREDYKDLMRNDQ